MTDARDVMSPYEQIGGEDGVRTLVDRFYDLMDELPEAATVRGMHAKSLKVSREKLFWFLTGWLGGPQLYVERFGHPRLRMRHFPFAIDTAAAEQWMLCMRRALNETVSDEALRGFLDARLEQLALHMRNQPEG
ncbi:MAG: group II truncated hemoglobin [Sandaracinus sp.]|nr:group II truncated hemoglobin [Myxococcales bacterium]MCB9599300.1 group II truncated hemoglobin [Sandaracinus sp.]MCB9613886.1 group II truncated hemoglobin [Sandaracinus sp.]MCB9620528.1 group II truncated hemoglobin [Sandaracinus sp.]MCB9634122.1 group II truncated hemoglobin [Sandaracinus sp.]